MFNPERLLGKMVKSTMKKGMGKGLTKGLTKGMGGAAKGALAMGALGVAFAAFDHFTQKQAGAATPQYQPNQPTYSPQTLGGPPPSPSMSVPPPPPGAPKPEMESQLQAESVLLIQAMIAAANADGVLDAEERQTILDKLNEEEMTTEEKQFISESFLSPPKMDEIVRNANTPELAQQVYAVSFITITVDTLEERQYLHMLAQKLHLLDETVKSIHAQFGVE